MRWSQLSPAAQDRMVDRATRRWIAGGLLAFLIVDVLTRISEFRADGLTPPVARILLNEISGVGAYLATVWLIGWCAARVPPDQNRWTEFLPFHLAASLVTGALAISAFAAIRALLSPMLLGETYVFHPGFFYEYRKFLLYYAAAVLLFTLRRQLAYRDVEAEAARDEAQRSRRITIRDNSRTLMVEAEDVLWIKAASNYVDIATSTRTLLVRGTLQNLGEQLAAAGVPMLRVHRSYAVNGHHIAGTRPDGEGGLSISMSDGTDLPCSRRYRSAVDHWLDGSAPLPREAAVSR